MWLNHFPAGKVSTLTGDMRHATAFLHELISEATRQSPADVLYVDGGHCFNPYDHAEHHLVRDEPADQDANQIHVLRAMTAYQWHQCLSHELPAKLQTTDASLVIVNPYDALLTHSDLEDWESEDYTQVTLRDLKRTARLHQAPFVLLTDFARLYRNHIPLAAHISNNVPHQFLVESIHDAWRLSKGKEILAETRRRQRRLTDYLPVVSPTQDKGLTPELVYE